VDDFYRENILDHYKNPRNAGHIDEPTATAEGVNLKVDDGIVTDVRFNGRGCAISQAAASMLSDTLRGRSVEELSQVGKDDVLEELGIPLTPIRLKCAMLSVGVLKVALNQVTGEPLPEEWAGSDEIRWNSA
jgi:nitrogen fixation NifU-like protein